MTVVCGATVIAAVKAKASNPRPSRLLFLTSIILVVPFLVGSALLMVIYFKSADVLRSSKYDPEFAHDQEVLMWLSIGLGLAATLATIVALLIIALSVINLRAW